MTRKLTFLILALFALISGPGWGQNRTEYAELFTIKSADVVSGTTYKAHSATVDNRGWIITFGGNNKSVGTNSGNRNNCKLSNYSKYAVSPVTTSDVASAFVSTTSIADVSKISYTISGGKNQNSTNVYLIYSSDGITFSQMSLTSGEQGAAISSGTDYEFAKCTGYFGLLFKATNTSSDWRIDDVDITFYKASAPSTNFTVTYDANGGNDEPDAQEADDDNKVTITTDQPTYEGHSFTGWNTKANGTGESYEAEQEYTLTSNIKLYAQWSINSYTITLNVNGHTSDITVAGDETILSNISSTHQIAGLTFKGWSYSNGTNNISYVGENDKPTENKTIYAVFSTTIEGSRPAYAIVSSTDELSDGDKIVIVGIKNESNYAAKAYVSGNNVRCATVTMDDNDNYIVSLGEAAEYTLGRRTDDVYTLFDGTYYLYAAGGTGANNYLKGAENADYDNAKWSISINENKATIKTIDTEVARHTIRFNTNGSNDPLFSCYASGQADIYLYKKTEIPGNQEILFTTIQELSGEITTSANHDNATVVDATTIKNGATLTISGMLINSTASNLIIEDGAQLITSSTGVEATVLKSITAHGETGGWNFIASPINGGSAVSTVQTTESKYDLYRFNQAADKEWENVKDDHHTDFTTLNNGTGYLYANSKDVTLEFAGTLYNGNGVFPLTYSDNVTFAGWNLMGNPFPCNVSLTGSYYVMNANRDEVVSATDPTIAPCEGYFAIANAPQQTVAMTKGTATSSRSTLTASISKADVRGNANVDRAIVSFDEINALPKFNLNADNSKLYIPQDGKNYAVVFAANEGTLPLNFEVKENGTYTITVNTENIDAEYLHLIDNMTGMDIDVLATPSYTFEAKTSDYASRFKLVFDVKNEASAGSDSNFAYMSDGNLVISNIEGEATLQIVDMMGRVLSTETVSGSYNKALNLRAGVYVLNLNGMTQKIVVK